MKLVYKTEPWEHQLKALQYLMKRDTAALYTDMGTGKTKVMIDLMYNRGFKRILVCAPKKACDVWEKQIELHGMDGHFCVLNMGNLSVAKIIDKMSKLPKVTKSGQVNGTYVFIINYDKIWRKGVDNYFKRKTIGIDCIICDESHRIKGPNSKCTRYLVSLSHQVSHRYLVSGSPLAENPLDVYAQYKFLDPTIFGINYTNFRDTYENLDVYRTTQLGFRVRDKKKPFKNLDLLKEKMYSCAFYIESSIKLPKQNDRKHEYYMSSKGERLYHEFIENKCLVKGTEFVESSNALTLIGKLRQMTSGYAKITDMYTKEQSIVNIDTNRREEFRELLEEISPDEPIVVFAAYKKDLKNIRLMCKELGVGYSELSGNHDTLKDWVNGKTRVIAVQYSSGSESIDLTRARYCIYYTLTDRLALYEQSRKRIHRPGQTRPVYYIHLICNLTSGKSIDEKLYNSLKQKKNIVDYIVKEGWS